MLRHVKYIGIVFALLILLPAHTFHTGGLRAYKGNLFHDTFFTDPIEKLVIIFPDGEYFYFTTGHEVNVDMDAWMCIAILEHNGRDIMNAIIVVHNHPMGPPRFSRGDIGFLRILRQRGFEGSFLLYDQPHKKIYVCKE